MSLASVSQKKPNSWRLLILRTLNTPCPSPSSKLVMATEAADTAVHLSELCSISLSKTKPHYHSTKNQCTDFSLHHYQKTRAGTCPHTKSTTIRRTPQCITGHVTGENRVWLFPFLYHLPVVFKDVNSVLHTQQGEVWINKVICSVVRIHIIKWNQVP